MTVTNNTADTNETKKPVRKVEPKPKATKKSVKEKAEIGIRPGNYIYALGRRKRSSAQTRLYPSGKGELTVNGKKHDQYFVTSEQCSCLVDPLKSAGLDGKVDVDFRIAGGGLTGQSEAARMGLSRALIKLDPELRKAIKKLGFLTRDAREKERKKPGLKRARRAPQWAKR
ncbi:30S ribosomal protein S9 [Candidatus Uhrbacteria bacterium]|nr:30S ribosomal protein S9 [Candidatus Uhrbacteria bacterium]